MDERKITSAVAAVDHLDIAAASDEVFSQRPDRPDTRSAGNQQNLPPTAAGGSERSERAFRVDQGPDSQ